MFLPLFLDKNANHCIVVFMILLPSFPNFSSFDWKRKNSEQHLISDKWQATVIETFNNEYTPMF